ncbi:restriction endonuclease subunit S [Aquimonas sp.]|uniref:restriction endonuclease subunit S n=1 Tax=Aquimonas sp. TaxID=1872588 RepID=UPI0037C11D08
MSWKPCNLGDVLTLQRGHDLPDRVRVDGDVPVVSSSGVTGRHSVAKAEPPGVVTGRYGTIGEVFFLAESYWPLNTALYVVDFKGNDPKFCAYLLRSVLKNYRSEKAAVPGVDRRVLHLLKVAAPARREQVRIASVLSAYDDLIENNRRRIALLEESARLLYREWFVHLRFPGHEHIKIVDGLPDDWTSQAFGQVAELRYGKAFPTRLHSTRQ